MAHLFIRVRTYGVTGPNMAAVYSDRDAACARSFSTIAAMKQPRSSSRATSIGRESSPVDYAGFIARNLRRPFRNHRGMMIEGMRAAKELGAIVSLRFTISAKNYGGFSGGQDRAVFRLESDRAACRCAGRQRGRFAEKDLHSWTGGPPRNPNSIRTPSSNDQPGRQAASPNQDSRHDLREVHSTNRHSWSAVAGLMDAITSLPTANWMSWSASEARRLAVGFHLRLVIG